MTAWRQPTGAAVLAVALVGCTADPPTTPPSDPTRALWVAFELPAGDDREVELVHDELILWNDDVLHRFGVEGARDDVASLDLEDLFASVQVVSTACPV